MLYNLAGLSIMPYHLELGSDGRSFAGKAIVVDTKGHHYSNDPLPIKRAEAQKRVLESNEKEPVKKDVRAK